MSGLARMDRVYNKITGPNLLAVNYHNTPSETAANFERHLQWFSRHYVNVDLKGLTSFLSGKWEHDRPGLMIHFDDGLLNNATIAAPLLQKYGFTGWFQLVTDYLENIGTTGYKTMDWLQAKQLLKDNHEVCCHSCTHKKLRSNLTDAEIEHEVVGAYHKFEEKIGAPPYAYCYPGGEIDNYDIRAVNLVKKYYKYAFPTYSSLITPATSPYALSRCHLESGWSIDYIALSTGYLWRMKHRRIKKLYTAML